MRNWSQFAILLAVIMSGPFEAVTTSPDSDIPHVDVSNWAIRFGAQMWEIGKQATRIREIRERYQSDARIERIDGLAMVKDFAEEVENMMADKMEAIKRIMDAAEQLAKSHKDFERGRPVDYYNVKKINSYVQSGFNSGSMRDGFKELALFKSRHFGYAEVNTSMSAVHVPTNVYDGAPDVMNAIAWSEQLDRIFINNYESDPSLGWQYFGSAAGFMRQYPAAKWGQDEMDPDLFDCRLRPWYLQAAASAKDLLILVDMSGSMTGVRKEIARHVVLTLLDTLSENDFVNIYLFTETPEAAVPCFKDKLVQANLENIRELKMSIENMAPSGIANFTSGLSTAFEILAKYNRSMQGTQCNQAIMLVTDGASRDYREVFEKYNWPHKPVRLFSYLIGREITDTTSTKWMSCHNKGYFVRVTSLAEVREQVLKYIPVLARPMVLYKKDHALTWTPVYADVADPKMGDWLWEIRERRRQRERSSNYRQLARLTSAERNPFNPLEDGPPVNGSTTINGTTSNDSQVIERFLNEGKWLVSDRQIADHRMWKERLRERPDRTRQKYRLVTSVSTPVYDLNETRVNTANLLGVAGTDVPITEITKRTPAYRLGVNGYSFIVNNNGYVLYHPDFRPLLERIASPRDPSQFYDILKPNYNTVDLTEVELVDSEAGPRGNDSALLEMRREMVERREGESALRVRVHYDRMKRASVRRQRYYYRGLKDTPFSLGVALPEGYGHFRVVAETEIKREVNNNGINVTSFFAGKNWRVHPDWVYCRYNYHGVNHSFDTPEAELLHFMDGAQRAGWKWNSKHPRPHKGTRSHSRPEGSFFCDKHLMQSLVFDAQATEIFDKNVSLSIDRQEPHAMFQLFGISVAFVATRSGLLRWQDIATINDQASDENGHFSESNIRASDQVWYKRAVEQYEVESDSFVYAMPFDAGIMNESLVTASHAIFVEKDGYRAPAAVVGLQYKNSALRETFFNITSGCMGGVCKRTCRSDDLDCYVLDNNGYVVISKEAHQTGRFFGEIDGTVMDSLVYSQVYQRIRVYDYQAVCLDPVSTKNSASFLLTPWRFVKWAVHWAIGRASWLLLQTQLAHIISPEWAETMEIEQDPEEEEEENPASAYPGKAVEENGRTIIQMEEGLSMDMAYINKTRTRPCDKYVDLYALQANQLFEGGKPRPVKGRLANCNTNPAPGTRQCGRNYSIHKIPHSNLVLLVVDTSCSCDKGKMFVDPQEVVYNESARCDRMQDHLFRIRPGSCVSYHPEEEKIELCGGAGSISRPSITAAMSLLLSLLVVFNSLLNVPMGAVIV